MSRPLKPQVDVFDALANPIRRRMLEMLKTGPHGVTQLAEAFEISIPAVSQHLRVLRQTGLVTHDKRGHGRLYRLNRDGLADAAAWVRRLAG